jgi:triphosphoribosyl-dephospho-CoA synthetase
MITARLKIAAAPTHRRRSQDDLLAEMIAQKAAHALLQELAAWPKPGLVSHRDTGSHRDMDASMLQASIGVLQSFFADLARAGCEQADMDRLRAIGLKAEAAMLAATGGVNTHRGTIFGLGLLCAAAGATARLGFDATQATPRGSAASWRGVGAMRSERVRSRCSATAPPHCAIMAWAERAPRRSMGFAASTMSGCRRCAGAVPLPTKIQH